MRLWTKEAQRDIIPARLRFGDPGCDEGRHGKQDPGNPPEPSAEPQCDKDDDRI
jgi:hypothetical protein